MEWVEVRGKTIDVAVEAAMRELGITERDRVEIEVLQEPERGFLGIGAKDAIVKVKPRAAERRGRRRHKRGEAEGERPRPDGGDRVGRDRSRQEAPRQTEPGRTDTGRTEKKPEPGQGVGRSGRGRAGSAPSSRRGDGNGASGKPSRESRPPRGEGVDGVEDLTIEAQAAVVAAFLTGLVNAFGLEGAVDVVVEDETIVATVTGPQTEAMVGPRGSVIEAVHEIVKTVLSRKARESARVRLDIGGYGERRRQALSLYAEQLVRQALEEGGEIMLEPMSSSDRKAIHDVVGSHEGVRSYSEGEPPQRFVVIARVVETTGDPEPAMVGEALGASEEE